MKMRLLSRIILGAVTLAWAPAALAQQAPQPASPAASQELADGLHFSGSVRLRYEAIGGQLRTGFNASDELVSLRTALKAVWQHGPFQAGVEVDDSRAWGANTGTPLSANEVNTLEPIQAYIRADLGDLLGKGTKSSIQAGRFTMGLGSQRLIVNEEYRNANNGFTGIRGDVTSGSGYRATLFYVLPQLRLPDDGPSLRANNKDVASDQNDGYLVCLCDPPRTMREK